MSAAGTGAGGLTATAMARAVRSDPQFTLPVRPRLCTGLVVVPLRDGLVIEGTAGRQVLRGSAATGLVPRVLELLDGTRTVADLPASAPGVPEPDLRACVSLLYVSGVLEDAAQCRAAGPGEATAPGAGEATAAGAGAEATTAAAGAGTGVGGPALLPDGIGPEVALYLGRHLDTTRVNRSRAEAISRLARARVWVTGPGPLADALVTELARSGVRATREPDPHRTAEPDPDRTAEPDPDRTAESPPDLVVAVDTGGDGLDRLDRWCARSGVRWLRVALRADGIEVGPAFDARYTCCYRCFAADRQRGSVTGDPGRADASPTGRAAWAALVTTEVVHLLARVGQTVSTAGCATLDARRWTQRLQTPFRQPGCPRCCPLPETHRAGDAPLAYRYEQAVAFPPRQWLNPKDHQQHYRPANLALQRDAKAYPAAPKIALPPPEATPGPDGGQPSLTVPVLAGLLLRLAGLRDDGPAAVPGKVQRWAPTGGNLGSVQAYLLPVDVPSLDPAWYFYEPAGHRLARVRRLADPDGAATAVARACPSQGPAGSPTRSGTPMSPGLPAALLVLTGALLRVAGKYHDFGYRIVCLDAGVALAQLAALAEGYGLAARPALRWDDGYLLDSLRLDGVSEPVTAVVAIHPATHREEP